MRLLNITVRNILILVVIIALAVAMFWLVRTQSNSLLTTQASTPTNTLTPIPTNTFVSTTFTPSSTPPPLVNFDTPAPGPTYTPTPVVVEISATSPTITVVDRQMLPLDQLSPLSSMADEDVPVYALFEAVGWTDQGEIVLQERKLIERDGAYLPNTLYRVVNTVSVLPENGSVKLLSDWLPTGPAIVQGFMDNVVRGPLWVIHGYNNEGMTTLDWNTIPGWSLTQQKLANEWAAKNPITYPQYWYASPDGETVVLQVVSQKIYIFRPHQIEPVILPQDDNDTKRYESTAKARISPDGKKIVYGVRVDNSEFNDSYGSKSNIYEIHITDIDKNDTVTISLEYPFSNPGGFTWSPDSQFIAFTAQNEEYSEGHVYIARMNDLTITDITPSDFLLDASLYWLPDGLKLLHYGGNPNNQKTIGYWITSISP